MSEGNNVKAEKSQPKSRAGLWIAVIVVIIIVIAGGTYAGIALTHKPSTTTTHITLGIPGPFDQVAELELFVAQSQGFFQQNGLNVTLDFIAGAPAMMAAMTSGSVQFTMPAWSDVLSTYEEGISLQSFFIASSSAEFVLLSLKGSPYTNISSLKGQNIGVVAPDITTFLPELAIMNAGYNVSTFGKFADVLIGGVAQAALEAHDVVCMETLDPQAAELVANGTDQVVFNFATNTSYNLPSNALTCLKVYANENPSIVKDLVHSLLEAATYIHSNESGTLQIMQKTYEVNSTLAQEMYNAYLPTFVENGIVPMSDYQFAYHMDIVGGTVTASENLTTAYNALVNDTVINGLS